MLNPSLRFHSVGSQRGPAADPEVGPRLRRDVVRPAAHEWDEREEFPWPIVEEAAKIGLYGFDFMANAMMGDPTGLTLPVAIEELFWGDAGIGLSIIGSGLAAAGIAGNGTPEQVMEWVPQCYGTADDVKLGAFCVSEPDAGSDVSSLRTRAVYDEAKDEWVLNGTKAWITNGGIADVHVVVAAVDPELKGRGQASFIVPPGTPGLSQGQKYKKHGIRPRTPPRSSSTTCGSRAAACSAARRSSTSAGQGPRGAEATGEKQPAMATFEATRPAVAPRPSASPGPPTSTRSSTPRSARVRQADHHEPGDRVHARRHGHRDRRRPLLVWRAAWLARNGGYTNAEGSMSKLKAGRTAVWVTERAIQILGGYGYTREYPVERWHRDAKIYDIFEGTEQIQQLVIARAISGLRIRRRGGAGCTPTWRRRRACARPARRCAT
jgi:acyl-CoA dehydrogenase